VGQLTLGVEPDSGQSVTMASKQTNQWAKWATRVIAGVVLGTLFVVSAYTAFSMYVRRGGTVLPDVIGMAAAEARSALKSVGVDLVVDEEDARFSAEIAEGAVLRQRPQAGASVKKGSVVRVSLSKGAELAYLPDFSGDAVAVARTRVQADGLPAPRVLWTYHKGKPAGEVVAQQPRPGSRAPANQPLRLYVNTADADAVYLMPDVIYQNAERMRRWFENRGIRVGSIKPDAYRGVPPGTILRQYPLSGYPLSAGDVVAFVVASGEQQRESVG